MSRSQLILEKLNLDYSNGIYINCKLDHKSADALRIFASRLWRSLGRNIDTNIKIVPEDELHLTLCYSKTNFSPDVSDIYPLKLDNKSYSLKVLGKDNKPKVIVLAVKSKILNDRNLHLQKLGATSDFDEYQSHITLLTGLPIDYRLPDNIYNVNNLSHIDLILTSEQIRPLDPSRSL